MRDYQNLAVWKRAHELTVLVYEASRSFPSHERLGLAAQLRRSMVSVGSNIAEGSGRGSQADFARFVDMATGSVSEADYQLMLACDLGYLSADRHQTLSSQAKEIRMMLARLAVALKSNRG